jgi:PAS domain S-box-containing protein/putative nucleotidyltransferase with HDIG domain
MAQLWPILDKASIGLALLDREFRYLEINKRLAEINGLSREAHIGRKVEDLLPDLWPHVESIWRSVLQTDSPVENIVISGQVPATKDDQRFWLASYYPTHDDDGKVSGLALVVLDITDRQRSVANLEDAERRFRTTLDSMLEGCQIIDFDWRYAYLNKEAIKHSRKTKKQLLGRTMMETYPGIEKTDMFAKLQTCMRDRTPVRLENEFFYPDGTSRWFELSAQPVPEGIVVLSEDVTEKLQAEEALKESEKRFRSLFENMLEGFALCRMLYNDKGDPVDWVYLDVNLSFGRLTGLKHVVGKKVSEVLPGIDKTNPELFEIYGRVAKSGAPHEFETWVEPVKEWLHISVFSPEKDHFVAVFEDITNRKRAEADLRQSHESLKESFIDLVKALSATVKTRDPYTAMHQNRVVELSLRIAKEIGLSEEEADGLYMAALIHDIGKIYVPGEVLSKPGSLTDIEYNLVKTHSEAGYKIVEGIRFERPIAEIVRQHHEREDGSGYPRGLKGKDIIVEAKILAVADVVEAMSSHRPYRPALGIDAALREITANRGKLYNAAIVDICVALFTEKGFTFSTAE